MKTRSCLARYAGGVALTALLIGGIALPAHAATPETTDTTSADQVAATAPTITSHLPGTETHTLRPTISGTGEPSATIQVTQRITFSDGEVGAIAIAEAIVAPDGTWTARPDVALEPGPVTLRATQLSGAGIVHGPELQLQVTPAPVDMAIAQIEAQALAGGGDATHEIVIRVENRSLDAVRLYPEGAAPGWTTGEEPTPVAVELFRLAGGTEGYEELTPLLGIPADGFLLASGDAWGARVRVAVTTPGETTFEAGALILDSKARAELTPHDNRATTTIWVDPPAVEPPAQEEQPPVVEELPVVEEQPPVVEENPADPPVVEEEPRTTEKPSVVVPQVEKPKRIVIVADDPAADAAAEEPAATVTTGLAAAAGLLGTLGVGAAARRLRARGQV